MTRTSRYKLGYLAALVVVFGLAIFAIRISNGGFYPLLIVVLVLLVPGRLLGFFYRDLSRGRHLLEMQQAEASIPYMLRFLEEIRKYPGRKRLLWLAWSVYTPDAEAMALNNLGAARLELGDFAGAAEALQAALVIDPEYPLPHYNLAIERTIANDPSAAASHVAESERLGFRRTGIDAILLQAGALLARVEGRGVAPASSGSEF